MASDNFIHKIIIRVYQQNITSSNPNKPVTGKECGSSLSETEKKKLIQHNHLQDK